MTHSDFFFLSLIVAIARRDAAAADAAPRDARLAFVAFESASAAFDMALDMGSDDDVALALDADFREAALGGLSADC
jgi:hypothetical protein